MAILFEEDEAIEFGDREAIVIQSFRFWIRKNKANGRHLYDGHTWTYNDMKALAKLFSWWSIDQTRRLIDSLVKKEVLIKGNYNTNPHDRTTWYAFTDEAKFLREPKQSLDDADLANLPNASGENAKSNWQNNKIELVETQNPNGKTAKYKETVVLPVVLPDSYSFPADLKNAKKEELKKFYDFKNMKSDFEKFWLANERQGWAKVGNRFAQLEGWELDFKTKNPNLYVEGYTPPAPKKPTDKKYEKEKEKLLSNIKFILGNNAQPADIIFFNSLEIDGDKIFVKNRNALQYKDLLADNNIKIEIKE